MAFMNNSFAINYLKQKGDSVVQSSRIRIDFTEENSNGLSQGEKSARHQANDLLNNIEDYPHMFVLACLMDRQYPAAKCWFIPYRLAKDHNVQTFHFVELQNIPQTRIQHWMSNPPQHRFHKDMADVLHKGIHKITSDYSGDASLIWRHSLNATVIVDEFYGFHGVGDKIASMATNILYRHFKLEMTNISAIDVSADVHTVRVFKRLGLIPANTPKSDEKRRVIQAARTYNPNYPGVFDFPAWDLGYSICHEQNPNCKQCPLNQQCPSAYMLYGGG
jgi:endonuclease III